MGIFGSIVDNIRLRKGKDVLNPRKWKIFAKHLKQKREGIIIDPSQVVDYAEVIMYRAIMCRECVKEGKCHHCGCKVPENMAVMSNYCSSGLWDPLHDNAWREQWKDFKEKRNIVFKIDYL